MNLVLPVLVSIDARDLYEVRVPGLPHGPLRGPSLAEVLDDLALDVMEGVPKTPIALLPRYAFCPNLELRKVALQTSLPFGPDKRKRTSWKGRLSVVAQRWRDDGFWICTVPRLSTLPFAVPRLGVLDEALPAFLARWARSGTVQALQSAQCQRDEHLELLEVEVEPPTVLSSRRPKKKKKRADPPAEKARSKKKKEKKKFVPPVTLRQVATSLTHRALDGLLPPAFGRDALVERVLRELERPGAAVLLVGPSGVGKSAIIAEVVRRRTDGHTPLAERSDVWEVDGNRLIAGMSVVGQWEQRVERLVEELSARDDILVVDDLPNLVYTGRHAKSDTNVAGFLAPHLERGELRLLGECTPERLSAIRPEAPAFFGAFRILQVPPLDRRQTLLVLLREVRRMERDRPLVFEASALEALIELAERFHARACQPGASIRLLRRISDDVRPEKRDRTGRGVVGAAEVRAAYQRRTGLPDFVLSVAAARSRDEVRSWFRRRILAQDAAVDAVIDLVLTLQQGLDDAQRPIGSFLLVGPTGVGKTETAKALATWLFAGDASEAATRLIRFDMSEFRGPAATRRLVGHVDQPEGELTRAVARQPFSVVLFDEIEKADPGVFDVLLQVLGEGRLTNARGTTTDFSSTVILLTSNLGVAEARQAVGFGGLAPGASDTHFTRAAERFFKPEFVNRIDRIVPFRALERGHVAALVRRLVEQLLARRGLRRSGVVVQVDPGVVERIVDEGFDPAYGARALKRTLEKRLTVPLARQIATRGLGALTHVEVFPRGEGLEIALQPLVHADLPSGTAPLEADWEVMRAAYDDLADQHRALAESEAWNAALEARSQLVVSMSATETVDEQDRERLVGLAELVTRWEAVGEALGEVAETALATFDFHEDWDVERYKSRGWVGERRRLVSVSRPIPVDRRRLRLPTRDTLQQARIELAALTYRARHALTPPQDVILRILAETDDRDARHWAAAVAEALATALAPDAELQHLSCDGGEWVIDEGREGGSALALHARAPALAPLLTDLDGLWLDAAYVGPDLVSRLVRVTVLADGQGTVAERLAADDRAWQAWRGRRNSGVFEPNPRPLPPIVFHHGVGSKQPERLETAVRTRVLARVERA